jgi:hypothetical protein
METSGLKSLRPVMKTLWAMLAVGVLLLMGQAPARAKGPTLIPTESIGTITITSFAFGGPPGCDPLTGVGCTF